MVKRSILKEWEIDEYDLTMIIDANPSLRGMTLGYVAEFKFEQMWLGRAGISDVAKADDHDRTKKGDRTITYKGRTVVLEVKSLQTNTIRNVEGVWTARAQVDASDNRTVKLPNGEEVSTTCLLVGEFDILAVNTYAFEKKWRFVFAKNKDLPRTTFKKYKESIRKYLLATTVEITWPPKPPFYDDLFRLI
jgi:hypothetical protein